MSTAAVATSFKTVTDLLSLVQKEGENWYRRSAALERFKSNVTEFEKNVHLWQSLAETYGLSSEQTMIASFAKATTSLEEEKARLQNLERRHGNCCLFEYLCTQCGTAFPPELGESIQRLLTETIPREWKTTEAADAAAQEMVEISARKRQAFRFKTDGRYVPIPIIEQQIKNALENGGEGNQSARVVLLEGPAGTGKSCMGRHLALQYQAETNNASVSQTSANKASVPESSTTRPGYCGSKFDRILYLECGEKLDSLEKQKQLAKLLQWEKPLEPPLDTNQDTVSYVQGILIHLLRNSKVLIIFDDVWDRTFVGDVAALCGDRIRILITSQRSDLCDDLASEIFCRIPMNIADEDAHRILQEHTGFISNDDVPEPVQDCISNLINKVSTNPHALVSISTAIDPQRRKQPKEWQVAINQCDSFLSTAKAKNIHGVEYSSGIGVKFSQLNADEKNLVMLLAMLEGPSVPEVIVQLFSTEIMDRGHLAPDHDRLSIAFSRCRRKLEALHCVQVTESDGQYFWSIHSLDKNFVQEFWTNDFEAMFNKFQNLPKQQQGLGESQEHCVKILGALYIEKKGARITTASPFQVKENASKRNAIQPIISLMMDNICNTWSLKERSAADQVFLSYICHGVIHEEAIKVLLRSTISEKLKISILLEIVKASDVSLSEDVILTLLGVFGELRDLEGNGKPLDINYWQCEILYQLAVAGRYANRHLIRLSICKIRMIVLGLVEVFKSRDKTPDLCGQSIGTLGYLGYGHSPCADENRVNLLVNNSMLISELVHVLEDDMSNSLQVVSAWALCRFACFGTVQTKIMNLAGEQLVCSLGPKRNKRLQNWAAFSLDCLARGSREISLKIFNFPNALDYFLDILGSRNSDSDSDDVRKSAASALREVISNIFPSPELDIGIIKRVSECLVGLWAEGHHNVISSGLERDVIAALTLIDPTRGRSVQLLFPSGFQGRGRTLVRLGHYKDALSDLYKAAELQDGEDESTLRSGLSRILVATDIAHAKAKLKDWEGALEYADRAVAIACDDVDMQIATHQAVLMERGALKLLKGDLQEALKDLNESLALQSDYWIYEALKQRACVRYRLGDVKGAREDAKKALSLKPSAYDIPNYENRYLGTSIVEFLEFRL